MKPDALRRLAALEAALTPSPETPGSDDHDLPEPVAAFHTLAYELGIVLVFGWTTWAHRRGRALVEDEGKLAAASVDDLRRLVTSHVRQERFCEGHLVSMFQSGHLAALARRAGELAASS